MLFEISCVIIGFALGWLLASMRRPKRTPMINYKYPPLDFAYTGGRDVIAPIYGESMEDFFKRLDKWQAKNDADRYRDLSRT